ncbi:fumarylacetoacetate hydrolase [Mycena galopus ATCC 62051]|nr:fumarylacetoacetate hydrolase [Mycena galopus ATCC 62051]
MDAPHPLHRRRDVPVGLAASRGHAIKAHEIVGSALDPGAYVSKTALTVNQLLSPLSREEVKYVRCLGLNYAEHAKEVNLPLRREFSVLFVKPPTALIGPSATVIIPRAVQPVELTIVIGRPAQGISEANTLDYVLGYTTAANDVSFRKNQMAMSQWGFSKGFDNTNPLGPCLVATSAIPDPQKLSLKTTLNGAVMQDGNTAYQIFTVRQTVAFLSQATTLEPGSVILTGTPKGVGFVKKPPVYLKNGDTMSVWVGGGIGTLANDVVEEGNDACI